MRYHHQALNIIFSSLLLLLILLSNFFHLAAQSTEHNDYQTFLLTGTIKGLYKSTIHLLYTTERGSVWDSSTVENGRFTFKGKINEPTLAELSLDKEFSGNALNNAVLFLEPGKMNIVAVKDSLYFLHMKGSVSQKDQERLIRLKKISLLELNRLRKHLTASKAAAKVSDGQNDSSLKQYINSLEEKELLIEKEMSGIDSLFIVQNPASYVTAYLVKSNLTVERISFYPVDSLYYKMPDKVKNSSYGKQILWQMDKVKHAPVGSNAPAFSATAINGNSISLADNKGKNYVLLDFWGSWCFPCRQLNPFLKYLYQQYHSKGFEIISIAINDKEENWRKAVAEDSTGIWQHIRDGTNIVDLYAASWVPAFFLIDKEGKVMNRYGNAKGYGEKAIWDLRQDLERLFGKQ